MFVHQERGVNGPGATASSRDSLETATGRSTRLGLIDHRLVREAGLLALVLLSAILVLRGPAASQAFSVDESRWISTSRYFWITFVDHDLFGPDWRPNYIVYTHPPVARYLLGFGLWLQGWSPEQLNGRYDSLERREY